MGLVSCIIPVYNGEAYLRQALESVLAQAHRPLEILVIDDGSTDGTARLAQSFGPPVRYFFQTQAGPMAARNLGVAHAQGQWLSFLDADDLWHPDKLALQFEFLAAHPEMAGCVGMIRNFQDTQPLEEAGRELPGYCFPAMLIQQEAFAAVGKLDASLGHASDTEWMLRCKDSGLGIGLLETTVAYRRLHSHNRSRLRASHSLDDYLHMLKRRKDRVRGS